MARLFAINNNRNTCCKIFPKCRKQKDSREIRTLNEGHKNVAGAQSFIVKMTWIIAGVIHSSIHTPSCGQSCTSEYLEKGGMAFSSNPWTLLVYGNSRSVTA